MRERKRAAVRGKREEEMRQVGAKGEREKKEKRGEQRERKETDASR